MEHQPQLFLAAPYNPQQDQVVPQVIELGQGQVVNRPPIQLAMGIKSYKLQRMEYHIGMALGGLGNVQGPLYINGGGWHANLYNWDQQKQARKNWARKAELHQYYCTGRSMHKEYMRRCGDYPTTQQQRNFKWQVEHEAKTLISEYGKKIAKRVYEMFQGKEEKIWELEIITPRDIWELRQEEYYQLLLTLSKE